MSFECKIVLDSLAPCGKRLTTLVSTFPRIILAEVNTHRDRARNAASSRAIPFVTMSEAVRLDPFIPIVWGGEQSGMQAAGPIPEHLANYAEKLWIQTMRFCQDQAFRIHNIGKVYIEETQGLDALKTASNEEKSIRIHKSIPNRLLEPWMWCTQVMSATEWKNFFRLRSHGDAEVHFQKIARMMQACIEASTPQKLNKGDWHLPFVTGYDYDQLVADGFTIEQIKQISVARNARVSYMSHEGKRDPHKDIEMFAKLVQGSGFGHWSAHEHVAAATTHPNFRSGPYLGFIQYRKEFANECADKPTPVIGEE